MKCDTFPIVRALHRAYLRHPKHEMCYVFHSSGASQSISAACKARNMLCFPWFGRPIVRALHRAQLWPPNHEISTIINVRIYIYMYIHIYMYIYICFPSEVCGGETSKSIVSKLACSWAEFCSKMLRRGAISTYTNGYRNIFIYCFVFCLYKSEKVGWTVPKLVWSWSAFGPKMLRHGPVHLSESSLVTVYQPMFGASRSSMLRRFPWSPMAGGVKYATFSMVPYGWW
jgi:hypothetical protein